MLIKIAQVLFKIFNFKPTIIRRLFTYRPFSCKFPRHEVLFQKSSVRRCSKTKHTKEHVDNTKMDLSATKVFIRTKVIKKAPTTFATTTHKCKFQHLYITVLNQKNKIII